MNVPSLSIKAWLVIIALQDNNNQISFSWQRRNVHTIICLSLHACLYLITAINSLFYMSMSVHDFTFLTKQRYCTRNEIHTNMSWICRGYTYQCRSVCWISSWVYAIQRQPFSEKTLRLWKFGFAIIASASYFLSQYATKRTLTWLCTFSIILPNIARYYSSICINFFQNRSWLMF